MKGNQMESRRIKIEDLPDFLMAGAGYSNLKELANKIGITRATLHNWKNGSVNKIAYSVRDKLAKALDQNNWGFKIGTFTHDGVELIYTNPPVEPASEITYLNNKIDALQGLLNKLLNENFVLKEKIEKYEVKK